MRTQRSRFGTMTAGPGQFGAIHSRCRSWRSAWRSYARRHDNGANVLDRGVAAHDRRIGLGILRHLLGTARFAVAAEVEEVHVVAARGDVLHPGLATPR